MKTKARKLQTVEVPSTPDEVLVELERMREELHNLSKSGAKNLRNTCSRYLNIASKYQNIKHLPEANYLNGYAFHLEGNNKLAITYFRKAISFNGTIDVFSRTLIAMAVSYRLLGEYTKAIRTNIRALKYSPKEYRSAIYNNIAVLYFKLEDYTHSVSYFRLAEKFISPSTELQFSNAIITNLGWIYLKQNRVELAKKYLYKSIRQAKNFNLINELIQAKLYLARLYFVKNNLKLAERYCNSILPLLELNSKELLKCQFYFFYANLLERNGKTSHAKLIYLQALEISEKYHKLEFIENYSNYYRLLAKENNFVESLKVLNLIKRVIFNHRTKSIKSNLSSQKLEFNSKEKQLRRKYIIEEENLIKELEIKNFVLKNKNLALKKAYYSLRMAQQLRTQMNPHFIYNTLTSISSLIKNMENEKASKYLLRFSNLTRLIYNVTNKEAISLELELKIAKAYLDMEKLRLDENFNYRICIDESIKLSSIRSPSMILQPILENSIKHGIFPLIGLKKGIILIEIKNTIYNRKTNSGIEIKIKDNGVGNQNSIQKLQSNERIGAIKIAKSRLELYNNIKSSRSYFRMLANPDGGLSTILLLLKT